MDNTAGCSIVEVMICLPLQRFANATPLMARLSDSEPPPVKTILRAVQFRSYATLRLAESIMKRASFPAVCMLEGFPEQRVLRSIIVLSTSLSIEVVAL